MTERKDMTVQEANESAFICRTFFARGGDSLDNLFVSAKNAGVSEEWFVYPFAKLVWMAAEDVFKHTEKGSVTLTGIVRRANQLAKEQSDIELKNSHISNEDFERIRQFVSSSTKVDTYVKDLRNALIERKVKALMQKVSEEMAASENPELVVSRMIADAKAIVESKSVCKRMSLGNLCDQALADWDEAYHQRVELGNYEWCPGLPLPWRKLSYTLNGFTPDVTILAARPGVGKTSFALNFARYWLDNGFKVVFVSVDMSPIGFVKRQISERSNISLRKLQFGKSLYYQKDREKIVAEINQIKELEKNENFVGMAEHNVNAIKSACTIMKDQGKIDVLIVDYLQLLSFKGAETMGATQKATYVSNTLHELAVELQIPVLCLSQLNRENTKDGGRDPLLSDLRDSGAIEQDAANVLLLYRNEKLLSKWKNEEPPVQFSKNKERSMALASYCPIWCLVAKSREGDAGTKLPFVVVQNKYSWHLGDFDANGEDQFARVYDDWRHDPIENVWMENEALIRMVDVREREIFNLNRERTAAGLPPIPYNGKLV